MAATGPDTPLMLRVYKDDKKGATAFFRNRPFLDTITTRLKDLPDRPVQVLFHACSIGAEPYSFAATAQGAGLDVTIDATDIEPDFIEAARRGVYPAQITSRMRDDEKRLFADIGQGHVKLDDTVRDAVRFLPAMSLLDPPAKQYDAVFAMNVLTYLTPEAQTQAIATMARAAAKYLCVTAFHPDTIQADMQAAGFTPVLQDQQAIHDAWGDRVRAGGAKRGTPEYSWVVPPYHTGVPDYQWRYGAIFMREDAAS